MATSVTPVSDTADRLVNEHVAANLLGLKVATLRRWRWANRGPISIKVGNAVRYSIADLDSFIAAGRRPTLDQGTVEAPATA